jgi:hypothetical protein
VTASAEALLTDREFSYMAEVHATSMENNLRQTKI